MKNNKYKILILSDMKGTTESTIKNSVSLAKMINGSIDFLHIKRPIDIVERESQLSSMRTISRDYISTKKQIDDFIKSFKTDYKVDIGYHVTFGNVKSEIEKYIEEKQPDIIVLGKRKNRTLKFAGDGITDFIIKKHKGMIFIASDKNGLEPNQELTLGVLNNFEENGSVLTDNLMSMAHKPVKSFKILKASKSKETPTGSSLKNAIEYVFEAGDNAINSLSNYVSKNNINLLCVNRLKKSSDKAKVYKTPEINSIINKLDVSLLLTA